MMLAVVRRPFLSTGDQQFASFVNSWMKFHWKDIERGDLDSSLESINSAIVFGPSEFLIMLLFVACLIIRRAPK